MRIGIISEGKEDQGVIKNILLATGKEIGIESADIIAIRPDLGKDERSLQGVNPQSIGTFQGVKNACLEKEGARDDFERFFIDEDNKYIVIQIDTAEIDRQDFPFSKPEKEGNMNYSTALRHLAIEKINEWLAGNYADKLLYAIAIEEIEAWCLTIFETEDTTYLDNLKNRLQRHLARKNLTYKDLKCNPAHQKDIYFEKFTKKFDFHKIKILKKYSNYNQSLNDFITSLEHIFIQNYA